MRPEEITIDMKHRLETTERDIQELKRQQSEVVIQNIKVMYEISAMIEREKDSLMKGLETNEAKLSKYQKALGMKQQKM